MGLTKRWIESEKMKGNNPLNEDHEDFVDDVYWYEQYCHYSGLPSTEAYDDGEIIDDEY